MTQDKIYENKTFDGPVPRVLVTDEFIEKNSLTLKRTQEEILKRLKGMSIYNIFGGEVLYGYLTFENLLSKEGVTEKGHTQITDVREATQDMLDYLIFGYGKAMDCKGLSASRTINKLCEWFWLLGRDDLADIVEDDSLYNPYGTPALIKVSDCLGVEYPYSLLEFSKNKCEA